MNLVVGSTGLLGMEVCRQLRSSGRPARGLIRPTAEPAKHAQLQQLGMELALGDLKDPASLRRACMGVDTVISTASSTFSRQPGDSIQSVDAAGQLALVAAASQAGVRRFIFISFRAKPEFPCPLSLAKQAVQRQLKSSAMEFVVLQASYFMEIWLTPMLGFDALNGKVRVFGEGDHEVSWVSYKDVARVAAAAADHPAARNVVLEVGGPEALSPKQVVRMFEAAGAAEIETEFVPTAALRTQYAAATDPMQKSFAALMLSCALGDAMDVSTVANMFSIRLTPVRDYVSSVLAQRPSLNPATP